LVIPKRWKLTSKLRCTKSQKREDLIYTAAEALNHASSCAVYIEPCTSSSFRFVVATVGRARWFCFIVWHLYWTLRLWFSSRKTSSVYYTLLVLNTLNTVPFIFHT